MERISIENVVRTYNGKDGCACGCNGSYSLKTADDIAVGAYVPADLPGVVCGYHLSMVRPLSDTDGAFVKRLFDSTYAKSCFEVRANGLTRVGLGQYELDNVELPFPPRAEQSQIAAFLDRETAKIDALVAEQQRLMELLKEKRQAVISHAVTKGLNPKAAMKPSGIEWLGDVPEHWETKPLKAVAKLFGRIGFRGYTTEDIVDEGQGAITLSPSNMVEGKLALEKCTFISWDKYNESPEIQIAAHDVLIVKTGSTFGKTAFVDRVDQPMTINPQIAVFKNVVCAPQFLFHVLNTPAIQSLIEISNKGSTIPTMTQEAVGNFWIGLPPHSEQIEIVAFIEAEQAQLNELSAEAQRAIDLLQERRTALISAAVTGQIDVRPLLKKEAA